MQKYTIHYKTGKIWVFAYSQAEAIQRALKIRIVYGFINNIIVNIEKEREV